MNPQRNPQRNLKRLTSALLPIGLAGSAACGTAPGDRAADVAPRDILLVTVDTLRADHLSLYGYARPTSPHLDRWFAGATVFHRAYATEAATAPSVATILTALLPQEHRVRLFYQLLPDEIPTIADQLGAAGYQTAAVVSNVVLTDEATGLGARFDHYDDFVDERESRRAVWERNASRTTDAALAWLRGGRDRDRPHFLWIHYIDPHGPYRAPTGRPATFAHEGFRAVEPSRMLSYQIESDVADALDYVDRYDEEIAYCDREIGRLLDAYAELGLADDAVIAFTADHGETMIEREYWFTHQYHVHEPIVRVPLMLRLPGAPPRQVPEPVSLIDLAPTLMRQAGVAVPESAGDRSLLTESRSPVYAEATSFAGDGQRRTWIDGDRKWVLQVSRPAGEPMARWWHDLAEDPDETQRNAWSAEDTQRAEFLMTLAATDPDPGGAPVDPVFGTQLDAPKVRAGLDAEQLEALRHLGYVR